VRFVALIALEETIVSEVREDVTSLLRHEHAGVLRIGQVDFRDLLREVLIVGVEFGEHALVDGHARRTRGERVAWVDAGNHGKGVVMLGHGGRGHGQEDAFGVDKADGGTMTDKGDGMTLDDRNANMVGKQAHDRSVLHPGDGFELLAALVERNKEDVAADVFAEDGEDFSARNLGEAGGFDISGAGDAEAGVAAEIGFDGENSGGKRAENDQSAKTKKDASHGGRRTPPGTGRLRGPTGAKAQIFVVGIHHLERHAGQGARIDGRTGWHTPESGFRGRIILKNERPRWSSSLVSHA